MAGPQTRHNRFLTDKDEFTRRAPTKASSTPTPIPVVFCAPTPASTQALAPAQASVPGPPGLYPDADLQRVTKLALELFVKG